ncbi:protein SHORT-ROOT-like [Gastrolobium bilobum]|uniref:protein SHORT-ROOT-like n=1 Tax=Gastrolobium bilobum TaxID=150636 RepID=UPI002AB225E5|nr:protein SHORT-ROOT-like [Gastrolobium bilobum]
MDTSLYIAKKTHYNIFPNQQYIDHEAATIDMHHINHPQNSSHTSTSHSSDSGGTCTSDEGKLASKLLKECAKAISDKDSGKIHHLLWMLNELASPYGNCEQKLASYFLQALFCKATECGQRCYKTLSSVAEKNHSFNSARKLILKFQEVSPWTTFGHVASNGAILEAFEGETTLHIIDISNTLCTQWPTLLEALATRNDETPNLKLTVVAITGSIVGVVTVVEEEGDFCSSRNDFFKSFEECLRFYTLYFEMQEESFPSISNERLMLERECSRNIIRVLACNDDDEFGYDICERRERGTQWSWRLKEEFFPIGFSDDVVDDVKALLKRYRPGWSLVVPQGNDHLSGIYLTWKEEPVVWASVWKP